MKKILVCKILGTLLFSNILYAKKELTQSQPEILFSFEKLQQSQENLELQVEFNKAVLLLNRAEYKKSIEMFENTSKYLFVPSQLNIAIAYFKQDDMENAKKYFNVIFTNENNITEQTYPYMSSCYYLYQITKDNKYLEKIVKISKKFKNLSEHSKRMIADTYVILKDYVNALQVLDSMIYSMDLKKALIYLKIDDYEKATMYLNRAKEKTSNPKTIDKILWFMVYANLKSNNLKNLKDILEEVNKRRSMFHSNIELPLEMFFNKDRYSPKDYLKSVLKFDKERRIDFVFYFIPYIFSDSQEIIYDSVKGFIYSSDNNIKDLDYMLKYNQDFLNLVKSDPVLRVQKLKELINKDSKSYMHYNLGIAMTQIGDFNNAFLSFERAYKLNPGNKLYASVLLMTADKIKNKLRDKEYIETALKTKDGSYNYYGKELYKTFLNTTYTYKSEDKYEETIFYKALDFIKKMDKNEDISQHALLNEYLKDPLIYLIKFVQRNENEKDYDYFSRLQDTVPMQLNNNFLEGPLIISQYYMDVLRGLGLFLKADFEIEGNENPSYLLTKALRELYFGNSKGTLKILESLQKKYNLEDKYTMYLMVAVFLDLGKYNEASLQLSLIKAILNDSNSDFLTAIQLIQELKITSAIEFLKEPYTNTLIDFRLKGLDEYLDSL